MPGQAIFDRDDKQIQLNLARLKKRGKNFEIVVDADLAIDFKDGKVADIKEVLKSENIFSDAKKGELASDTQIKEIIGDGNKITGVKVLDKKTGESYVIDASGVFLAIGSEPNTWFLKGEVVMDPRGYLVMQKRTQKTSKKALYAAGDVESERPHQAILAAGMGRQAGIEAVLF